MSVRTPFPRKCIFLHSPFFTLVSWRSSSHFRSEFFPIDYNFLIPKNIRSSSIVLNLSYMIFAPSFSLGFVLGNMREKNKSLPLRPRGHRNFFFFFFLQEPTKDSSLRCIFYLQRTKLLWGARDFWKFNISD